ncbi:MAG: hypothetical protein IPK82_02030 [Polyangiaceae bacterium]|nr:hypothetical protein [Polyangiaceae bacterium]
MRLVTRSIATALFAVSLALPACGGAPARTRIEKGETVSTGAEAFDTFFREVAEVNAEASKTSAEATDASKPLEGAVGEANKATPPPEVVRAEAKKLQMAGNLLHLDLVPETKLSSTSKLEAPSEKLLGAAEQSAKNAVAVARRASEVLVRIGDMERRARELLDKAKSAFPDAGKREEVVREISGAQTVLSAARAEVEKNGGIAARLALDLTTALETGAGSSVVAKKPGATKPGGTKPGGTTPTKPKGDDFDR